MGLHNDLLRFHRIVLLFLTQANLCFVFQMSLLRSIKAYLCPHMINFDGVNLSERRSKDVISVFCL